MPLCNLGHDELGRRNITLPIIMITGYAEVPMAVRALKAGAHDFIQKPLDGQLLLDRIQQAIEADQKARQAHAGRTEVASHLAELTPRQRQVLDGVLEGKPSKIIAADLGLSAKTVDVHRARIMEKLGAQSLPDLFRLVVLARSEKV